MSFPASEVSTCSACNKTINVGDQITWSRRSKGERQHIECWEETHPATAKSDDSAVTRKIEELESLITKMAALTTGGTPAAKPETAIVPVAKKVVKLPKENAKWWEILETIITWANENDEYVRVLLIGPPGTGKSTTALKVAGIKGEYRMTFNEKMSIEDCIGMMHLIESDKGGTKTGFVPIKITCAMEDGQKMLWDEVDHHSPEVSSALYGWLDDDPHVTLMDGKTKYAKKGYGVVATTNSNVTSLTEAVFDRFDAVLQAIDPHPDALAMLPSEQMRAAVKNRFKSLDKAPWTWSGQASLRRMRSFARFAPVIGEVNAATVAFGSAGKELLGQLATAARTATAPSSL